VDEVKKAKKIIIKVKRNSTPMFIGRIIDVVNEVSTSPMSITQGIKSNQVSDYENKGYTVRNGNAWIGYPETTRSLYLVIQDQRSKNTVHIDVRERALKENGRTNVTDKFVGLLKAKLVGVEVKYLTARFGDILEDYSILRL
jgi:hypothetical protein